VSDGEWATLQEAADMLGVEGGAAVAQELDLSKTAVLFTDLTVPLDFKGLVASGRIPARMIVGHDYMFTTAANGSGDALAKSGRAHPVSHLLREAVLPWAAKRAVDMLCEGRKWVCPHHGLIDTPSVLWEPNGKRPSRGPFCGQANTLPRTVRLVCMQPLTEC
jgi:hypothetical protein